MEKKEKCKRACFEIQEINKEQNNQTEANKDSHIVVGEAYGPLIYNEILGVKSHLERIELQLQILQKQGIQKSDQNSSDPLKNIMPYLPAQSWENLILIDSYLDSEEVITALKTFFATIGGVNAKNLIKRILARTFSNYLASQCSYHGLKGNNRLKDLKLMAIMKESVRTIFKVSELDFESFVKEWFKHGKQRYDREKMLSTDDSVNFTT